MIVSGASFQVTRRLTRVWRFAEVRGYLRGVVSGAYSAVVFQAGAPKANQGKPR